MAVKADKIEDRLGQSNSFWSSSYLVEMGQESTRYYQKIVFPEDTAIVIHLWNITIVFKNCVKGGQY